MNQFQLSKLFDIFVLILITQIIFHLPADINQF